MGASNRKTSSVPVRRSYGGMPMAHLRGRRQCRATTRVSANGPCAGVLGGRA
jgi:hypothetical protein